MTGNALANSITAGSGNDTLDGGTGADTMAGGAGNDSYVVDNAGDLVTENAGAGVDTVRTSLASYTLAANVENLVGTAATGQTLTGNALNNTITGGAGNDMLSGGGGNDTINAGWGDIGVLSGNYSDYVITPDTNYWTQIQTITVADQRAGAPDGVDTISGNYNWLALLRFADSWWHLIFEYNPPLTLSGGSVAENPANGTAVGTVTTDGASGTLTYSLTDNAGGRFAINAASGQLTVANGSVLDYESATSHAITVRVTNELAQSIDESFTINLTNVNEAPSNATLSGGLVAENAANGTVVGTVTGADPDAGATLSYSLTNNAGGRFAINGSTGQLTVANGSLLDYESATSHAITVRVTDQGGLTYDRGFTITVTNANEAPTNATLSGGSVGENAANGTVVGTVTGVDPDAGATLSYSLTNNAGGRFAINASTGQLTVANGSLLDYETATSHAITVRVTDQGGLTFDRAFTINVTNVNDAPSDATLSANSVAEGAPIGTVVGTVTGYDQDAGATLTYSLAGNAGGRFAINPTTGQLTVANPSMLDYESATSHAITVRVTDQGGLTFDQAFTINVTNVTGVTLVGTEPSQNPHFPGGDDTLTGTGEGDTLSGLGGNDTLNGLAGSDLLYGGTGNDSYVFNRGDGADTVYDNCSGYWESDGYGGSYWVAQHIDAGSDLLVLGSGIAASDIVFNVSGNDLIVGVRDPANPNATFAQLTDRITLQNWFDPLDRIETIQVGGINRTLAVGTTGDDTMSGTSGNDWLVGRAGNDSIQGNAGNDVLAGGGGNDTLVGGAGYDTYVFGSGGGQDIIVNGAAGNSGASGELQFAPDIDANELWFRQTGNDLTISVMGGWDQVTVSNWFSTSTAPLQEIRAAGGLEIDSGLAQLVQAMATYSANNPGFNPASATQAPNDPTLQAAIAAAWHS